MNFLLDYVLGVFVFAGYENIIYGMLLKRRFGAAVTIAASFLVFPICNAIALFAAGQFWALPIVAVVVMTYILIMYEGRFRVMLFAGLSLFVIMIANMVLTLISMIIIGGSADYLYMIIKYNTVYVFDDIVMELIYYCYSVLTLYGFVLVVRALKKHHVTPTNIMLVLMPINFILMMFTVGPMLATKFGPEDFSPSLLFFPASLIASSVVMFKTAIDASKNEQNRVRLLQLEQQQQMQYEYYRNLVETTKGLMKLRHDFKNTINVIDTLYNSGHGDEAGEMLGELRRKNDSLALPVYCSDAVMNAIVWDKFNIAVEKGIAADADIKLPEKLSVDKLSLSGILLNLLDNAIRACEGCSSGEKQIRVSCCCELNRVFIIVSNTSDEVEIKNNKLRTTKKNSGDHGLGTEIVKDIANKCSGEALYDYSDGVFTATVSIPLSEAV